MNSKIKNGLLFGIYIAVLFIVKGLFSEDNFTVKNVTGIIVSSLAGGTAGGFVFSWIASKILKKKEENSKKLREES